MWTKNIAVEDYKLKVIEDYKLKVIEEYELKVIVVPRVARVTVTMLESVSKLKWNDVI